MPDGLGVNAGDLCRELYSGWQISADGAPPSGDLRAR
jgi:hypothetical protein